jgi:hypothetical protein
MINKTEPLPGPVSQRQHMYVTADVDVTLFGGELSASN